MRKYSENFIHAVLKDEKTKKAISKSKESKPSTRKRLQNEMNTFCFLVKGKKFNGRKYYVIY